MGKSWSFHVHCARREFELCMYQERKRGVRSFFSIVHIHIKIVVFGLYFFFSYFRRDLCGIYVCMISIHTSMYVSGNVRMYVQYEYVHTN